jgi:hypothetical protein
MYRINSFAGGLLFLLFAGLCGTAAGQHAGTSLTIVIKLSQPPDSVSIKAAPLKYNKDFAFSFTLDDGLISDYLVAFPFFSGGSVSGKYKDQWGYDQGADGKQYPGLFYTDGCGHPLSFKAGIAINAKNVVQQNTIADPGYLSWTQINRLYHAGWDILNHSYDHATGTAVDARQEVARNNQAVRDHVKMNMKDFVIPGGKDDYKSDGPYTKAAFDLGMETVQCEHFGNDIERIDSGLLLAHLKLGRKFLHTGLATGRMVGDTALLKVIGSGLRQHHRFWINAFTHGVGNQNIWHISLVFPQFSSFFDQLAKCYGQKGADDMWMAPTQEVYEYLLTRGSAKYTVIRMRRRVIVKINVEDLPGGLRYHELTLLINGGGHIKNAKGRHCSIESYSGDKGPQMVNVRW